MRAQPRGPGPGPDGEDAGRPPVLESRAFGRYTLCLEVAQGGMASVHLAQIRSDAGFRKWTAVKIIKPHLARDERYVKMFLDEARLAARIEHPNVCTVFDVGEHEGAYFLAMEYLHGEPLDRVLHAAWSNGGLPREVAARIVADAARGLHAAHELRDARGRSTEVVHRDVSPQNIFVLYEGLTKVVDFGIARSRGRLGEHTQAGQRKGKLAYMAPEQVRDTAVDRRTDVFALGIVLWESTMGRRLFKRDADGPTMAAIVRAEVPAPTQIDPAYPPALEAVVLRALAREPSERYPTADAMVRELEAYLSRASVASGPGQVADFMHALFAERIATRNAVLRAGLEQEPEPRSAHAVVATAAPAVRPVGDPTLTSAGLAPAVRAPGSTRHARGAWTGALLALLAIGSAALAYGVHARNARHASRVVAPAPVAPAPSATRPPAPPAPLVVRRDEQAPPVTPAPPPPRAALPPRATRRAVSLRNASPRAPGGEPPLMTNYNRLRPR